MYLQPNIALTFDDVIIQPGYSDISSRNSDEISTETVLCKDLPMKIPIVSANMDTITGGKMAKTMYEIGGYGIIHRFNTICAQGTELLEIPDKKGRLFSIGVGKDGILRLETICYGREVAAVCIDIAHGHCKAMVEQIKIVKAIFPKMPVIAGNIATTDGAICLIEAGADAIKVGIGPGSLCVTRQITGCGVPQLTAIIDIAKALDDLSYDIPIIADGGVKNSGDIIKALAGGASSVMIGSLLAGCLETPGDSFWIDEYTTRGEKVSREYKRYRGMASEQAQLDWKGYVSVVEGESTLAPASGSATTVIENLMKGVRSGMSYIGAKTIQELQEKAVFIRQTSAGYKESTAHRL